MKTITRRPGNSKEQQLVNAFLKHRDETAFRRLYRQVTPSLYMLVLRLLGGNEPGAQDVIQDTWIRGIKRLGDFRWESSFQTWMSGIAINRCREEFRQQKRRNNEVGMEEIEAFATTVTRDHIDRMALEKAIERLPDGCRQVFVLYDIEGYKHREIGQLLNITASTSKSQLFHARKALRNLLKSDTKE